MFTIQTSSAFILHPTMNLQTNCLQLNLSFNISSSLMLNKFQMYMQWQANIDTITATNTGTNTDTNKFTNTDANTCQALLPVIISQCDMCVCTLKSSLT